MLALALGMTGCIADSPTDPGQGGPPTGVPPTLRSWIAGHELEEPSPVLAASLRETDVLSIALEGHVDRRISYVGMRIGDPVFYQDSTGWTDSVVTGSFNIALYGAPLDTFTVRVFLRDNEGNLVTVVPVAGHVSVFDNVERPWRSAGYPVGTATTAFSPNQSRLYFGVSPATGGPKLETLDLQALTYGTPVSLPEFPHGFDISAGGDSLIAALGSHSSLGVIDLARSPGTVAWLPLDVDST